MTGAADGTKAVLLTGDDSLIAVPSQQELRLQDVIMDEDGPNGAALRFRFLAPQIAREGGSIVADTATTDLRALCDSFVLPRLADLGGAAPQIILSMSDVAVPFGEAAPEATQYFEAFSVKDGVCIWEIY